MIFEDDETLRMYVEESLEHLSDIENDLLEIEEGGANIDEDLVNNVFRAAHSIKGGAGFMGLSTIKDLSHNLENVLGLIRTQELVPRPDMISILLKSFDKLRELIESIEDSNTADIQEFVEALISVTTDSLPDSEKGSLSNEVEIKHPATKTNFIVSQYDIEQSAKQGKFIYIIEFDLINDIHRQDKNPITVMNSLLSSGVIIDSKIDFLSVGTLEENTPVKIPFFVLFASIIEPDIAPTLIDIDEQFIHMVSEDMIALEGATATEVKKPEPVVTPEPVTTPEPVKVVEQIPTPVAEPVIEKVVEPVPVAEVSKENLPPIQDKGPEKVKAQTSLRVNVNLLDTLMTLAGELVLSRNQLLQGVGSKNDRAMESSSQRIDMITSELQEAIMKTRMQPISNVFTKFTRVVRDLAQILNKQVELTLEGKEVELDKTIIESINDPLTHLVRNSVDHGIELPDIRAKAGKPPVGSIKLRAYHEAGQVNIEISDDGKGLDGDQLALSAVQKGLLDEHQADSLSGKEKIMLIFLPGFSTAKEITDVSGRGVGMDVVKTNLDKLGGIVDIDSKLGVGTTIKIKLPLTLAIIPSQLISIGKERFAIPQVNLDELLRIPAAQVHKRIERVGDAEVVRLRGALLPLLNLADVLDIDKIFVDPVTNEEKIDRRSISDRRSKILDSGGDETEESIEKNEEYENLREGEDRRYRAASAINIAVVSAGTFKYGLIVDKLHDSEEIVVKPLGRHLNDCKGYAGATIMGDGKVALILDVASLAKMADLMALDTQQIEAARKKEVKDTGQDRASLLLFRNGEHEQLAAPLNLVERIERIQSTDIEIVGGKRVIQYRGGSLPLYEMSEVANVEKIPDKDQLEVIVFQVANKEIGLIVVPPVDAVEIELEIDDSTLRQDGVMGSLIVNEKTTMLIDIFEMMKVLNPDWFIEEQTGLKKEIIASEKKILFAEDSAFFRTQVSGFIEEEGYDVVSAEDGLEAWNLLNEISDDIMMVLTDLEMPNMDGFELTAKIRGDEKFSHLPVIALTSLAGEGDIAKGRTVGIDEYLIKLDKEKLLESIKQKASNLK
ncbi:MAG: hybrid sensor histidine kinase/response regulator [Desulfobacterales bacterium]|nr:hybrid sensor histidine kinase/response regulator [Desulfobacterales bacterium]MCP4158463.1 hybrid sensor histidine kinase/response regulator [Deltaproteobacteria bacterium]